MQLTKQMLETLQSPVARSFLGGMLASVSLVAVVGLATSCAAELEDPEQVRDSALQGGIVQSSGGGANTGGSTTATGGGGGTATGGMGGGTVGGGGTVAGGGATAGTGAMPCDITSLLVTSCGRGDMACHGPGSVYGLDLESPGVEMRVKDADALFCPGQKYIDSANVGNSALLHKIEGRGCGMSLPMPPAEEGGAFPPGDPRLTCLQAWVQQVAAQ